MDCGPSPKIMDEVADDLYCARPLVFTGNMDHGVRVDYQIMLLRKNEILNAALFASGVSPSKHDDRPVVGDLSAAGEYLESSSRATEESAGLTSG